MEVTHFNCVFCITWMPHCVREVNIIPVLEEKWSGNGWVIVLYMCCLMMYFQHNSFVKFIGFPILKGTQSKGWWLSCFVGINSYLGNTECVEFRVLLLSVCVLWGSMLLVYCWEGCSNTRARLIHRSLVVKNVVWESGERMWCGIVPAVVITWFLGFLHHMFIVTEQHAVFEVLIALLLRIQVSWGVMLCHWWVVAGILKQWVVSSSAFKQSTA